MTKDGGHKKSLPSCAARRLLRHYLKNLPSYVARRSLRHFIFNKVSSNQTNCVAQERKRHFIMVCNSGSGQAIIIRHYGSTFKLARARQSNTLKQIIKIFSHVSRVHTPLKALINDFFETCSVDWCHVNEPGVFVYTMIPTDCNLTNPLLPTPQHRMSNALYSFNLQLILVCMETKNNCFT